MIEDKIDKYLMERSDFEEEDDEDILNNLFGGDHKLLKQFEGLLETYRKKIWNMDDDLDRDMKKIIKLVISKNIGDEELTLDYIEGSLQTHIANNYAGDSKKESWLSQFFV